MEAGNAVSWATTQRRGEKGVGHVRRQRLELRGERIPEVLVGERPAADVAVGVLSERPWIGFQPLDRGRQVAHLPPRHELLVEMIPLDHPPAAAARRPPQRARFAGRGSLQIELETADLRTPDRWDAPTVRLNSTLCGGISNRREWVAARSRGGD